MIPKKCPKCGEDQIIEIPVNVKTKFGWCCGSCGYGKEVQKYIQSFENKLKKKVVNNV